MYGLCREELVGRVPHRAGELTIGVDERRFAYRTFEQDNHLATFPRVNDLPAIERALAPRKQLLERFFPEQYKAALGHR